MSSRFPDLQDTEFARELYRFSDPWNQPGSYKPVYRIFRLLPDGPYAFEQIPPLVRVVYGALVTGRHADWDWQELKQELRRSEHRDVHQLQQRAHEDKTAIFYISSGVEQAPIGVLELDRSLASRADALSQRELRAYPLIRQRFSTRRGLAGGWKKTMYMMQVLLLDVLKDALFVNNASLWDDAGFHPRSSILVGESYDARQRALDECADDLPEPIACRVELEPWWLDDSQTPLTASRGDFIAFLESYETISS